MADKIGKAITGYQNLVPAPQRQGGHRSSEADGHQVWVQIQVHIHGYTLVQGTLEYGRQPGLELGTLEYGRQPGLDQRLAPGVEQWRVQARLGPDNLYTSPENYLVMSQNPANNR